MSDEISTATDGHMMKKTKTAHESPDQEMSASTPKVDDTNKDYQFKDSDITLISSDKYHFKVHSYHLMAASTVFRDMIAIDPHKSMALEVILTDTEFETGTILSLFFHMCYGERLPHYSSHYTAYKRLIRFLDKYDCKSGTEILRTSIYTWSTMDQDKLQPGYVFTLACHIDDEKLAKRAITLAGGWVWGEDDEEKDAEPDGTDAKDKHWATRCIQDRSVFDLSACALEDLSAMPEDYRFALLRATSEIGISFNPEDTNWTKIADRFEIILKAIRER